MKAKKMKFRVWKEELTYFCGLKTKIKMGLRVVAVWSQLAFSVFLVTEGSIQNEDMKNKKLARPAGLEPATCSLGGSRSIQMS